MITQSRIYKKNFEDIEKSFIKMMKSKNIEIFQLPTNGLKFDPYVQLLCQECVNYGNNYNCHPYTTTYNQSKSKLNSNKYQYLVLMRDDRTEFKNNLYKKHKYSEKRALILATRNWDIVSYWEFHKIMRSLKDLLDSNDNNSIVLGSGGGCRLCRNCEVHSKKPCKKQEKSMSSPESWGIDVYGTLLNLGIKIEIPPRKIFTRVGIISTDYHFRNAIKLKTNNNRSNRPQLPSLCLNIEKELPGKVAMKTRALELFSNHSYCEKCDQKDIFICNRNFIPIESLQKFLKNRICVIVRFRSKIDLIHNLWKWQQSFHRNGFYDCLSFANYPCSICDNCTTKGCSLINQRRKNKFGNKELWRCINYLSLSHNNYSRDSRIGYLIMKVEEHA